MYGIINKAAEGFVRKQHGDETWDRVRSQAGLPDEPFVTQHRYEDATTFELLAAVSLCTGVPVEQVLEAFGIYWIEFVFEAGYGRLAIAPGDTLSSAFGRLDEMHDRIQSAFPESLAPRFKVTGETPDGITVDYFSQRSGLAPFVVGLIKGIGRRLGSEVSTTHERLQTGDAPAHDRFHVRWTTGSATTS